MEFIWKLKKKISSHCGKERYIKNSVKSIFKSLCNFIVVLRRTDVASKFQSNLEVFWKVLQMTVQGSCNNLRPRLTQVYAITVVSGIKDTIYKKLTSKLTKAGRFFKVVSFLFHDTIKGNEGLLGGVVVAKAGNDTTEYNPTTRNLMAIL